MLEISPIGKSHSPTHIAFVALEFHMHFLVRVWCILKGLVLKIWSHFKRPRNKTCWNRCIFGRTYHNLKLKDFAKDAAAPYDSWARMFFLYLHMDTCMHYAPRFVAYKNRSYSTHAALLGAHHVGSSTMFRNRSIERNCKLPNCPIWQLGTNPCTSP